VSELREVIGALQSEAEFGAAVGELGAAGIDRARGHCRVVRRRRPGGDFGSGRASPTEGDILGAWAGIILDSADGRELARCKPAGGAAGSRG